MKYVYRYFVYTNNLRNGYAKVSDAYRTREQAENAYYNCYINKYGACDIVRQRVYMES